MDFSTKIQQTQMYNNFNKIQTKFKTKVTKRKNSTFFIIISSEHSLNFQCFNEIVLFCFSLGKTFMHFFSSFKLPSHQIKCQDARKLIILEDYYHFSTREQIHHPSSLLSIHSTIAFT